jgi:hypothetical protein
MWLFTRYGFYSISVMEGSPSVCVRARLRKHLEALQTRFDFTSPQIVETVNCDYRYRLLIPKGVWEAMVVAMLREQTWSNFKKEVANFNGRDEYEQALHNVWIEMLKLQCRGSKQSDTDLHNVWYANLLKGKENEETKTGRRLSGGPRVVGRRRHRSK